MRGSPLYSKMLRYQSDVQTKDEHAMMKFDTFHSFRNLRHAVRGCHNSVLLHFSLILELQPRSAWMSQLCAVAGSGTERERHDNCRQMLANITTHAYVSPKTGREVVS